MLKKNDSYTIQFPLINFFFWNELSIFLLTKKTQFIPPILSHWITTMAKKKKKNRKKKTSIAAICLYY